MAPMRNRATWIIGGTLRVGLWILAGMLALVGAVTAQVGVVALASFAAFAGGLAGFVAVRGLDNLEARHARVAGPMAVGALGGLSIVLVVAGLAVVGVPPVPIVVMLLALALWLRFRPSARATGPTGSDPRGDLAALSDSELAREWRCSHDCLNRAGDAVELGRVSALRRWLLAEMERRNPVGFRTWMDSGTWGTGDSAPFLRP